MYNTVFFAALVPALKGKVMSSRPYSCIQPQTGLNRRHVISRPWTNAVCGFFVAAGKLKFRIGGITLWKHQQHKRTVSSISRC